MSELGYNYIYDKLVEDKNDILGIIAYSIYKRQKIEYLKKFKEENNREATQSEINSFKELSNSDTQLEFYRTQAVHLANAFLEEALSEHIEAKEQEFSIRVHAELSGIKNKFWNGVAQSLVGSILFVLFVGIIVFFSWSLNQGVGNAIESIFNIKITQTIPTNSISK
ncbi:MAG: hypothetical protein Q8L15_11495 [Methylobacter sp.]|nr:hypothetical protein [Methylobacter sp.]